jgi:hypothetical protein
MLAHSDPQAAKALLQIAQQEVTSRWRLYEHWAAMPMGAKKAEEKPQGAGPTEEKPQ